MNREKTEKMLFNCIMANTSAIRQQAAPARWDGSSFMWHQPCQSISVDIQKHTIKKKKLFTHVEWHVSTASLLKSGE